MGFININMIMLLTILASIGNIEAQKIDSFVKDISINAMPGLQYDVVRFKVKPKTKITISLSNVGDMAHNLVITKPGKRLEVVNAALQLGIEGPSVDYIPKGDRNVLWSIPLVSPGQTKSISFISPSDPGIYPYVCTYPGHGYVMYGAMYVLSSGQLPNIENDPNIPESPKKGHRIKKKKYRIGDADTLSSHVSTPPYLYRTFIKGASPAAIAVRLPQDLSYCWDAGACKLLLAWEGGFVDMSDLWKGHFNASAKILGNIFFRDNTDYPIRVGKDAEIPEAEYKGYQLVNGYPEFHYTLNKKLDVYELIRPQKDGNGLIRNFTIPNAEEVIWFYTHVRDGVIKYKSSEGRWMGDKLMLLPKQSKQFTITMSSDYLYYKKPK